MFTLLNAPNKNPYIKEFGGRTQSLFPDQIKSKTSMSQIKTPIEKKGGKEFQFSKIRVPVQMLSEYIQEFDPANQTPHDKGIKSLDIQFRKTRKGIFTPKIEPNLYRQITLGHKGGFGREQNFTPNKHSAKQFNASFIQQDSFVSRELQSPITKRAQLYLDNMHLFKAKKPITPGQNISPLKSKDQSILQSSLGFDQSLFQDSLLLRSFQTKSSNVHSQAANYQEYLKDLHTTKLHPIIIEMNNVDVELTVTDDVIQSLFQARCFDNKAEINETQQNAFIVTCRQRNIEGRLRMADMNLGLKSAEVLCSLIMDKDFYVSHIDLRKNPLGDDGIILLMHAIKRVNSVIYLDLSSCNMTHIGANRILKSLCKNESIQHLILSNSEGQMKNALGWKFLEQLQPLFQKNCFIQYLDLSNNRFQDQGFHLIAKALYKNATILYLNLENCDFTSKSDADILKLFSSMKVLADLNFSRNKIQCKGALSLSKALIESNVTQLWRLNISNCDIKEEGTTQIICDLRNNKKLVHLILDYNRFESKDTFPPIFIDSIVFNKTLNNLSIAGCEFNKHKLNFLFDALCHNETLHRLNLSNNQLTTDDMRKFRDIFSNERHPLSLKHLDLSSNLFDDDGGLALLDAIYHHNTIQTLSLRNNLVQNRTARAFAEFVTKHGRQLKRLDLTMNKGIPVRVIEEIEATMARNAAREDKVKGFFMNMFKRICAKYDMGEEYVETMNQRRLLVKQMAEIRDKNQNWQEIVSRYPLQKQVGEGTTNLVTDAFEKEIDKLENELDELEPTAEKRTKIRNNEQEDQLRRINDVQNDVKQLQEQIQKVDDAIMVHPKSRKKQILSLRAQLQQWNNKMNDLQNNIGQMNQEIMDLKLLKPLRKKKTKANKKSRGGNRVDNQSRGIMSDEVLSKNGQIIPLNDDLVIDSNQGSDMENE